MDWILFCKALILGVVEGLTEFLPVSSTGHLIVAGSLLDFTGAEAKTFHVVIQFGAILAIVWEYRRKIGAVIMGLPTQPKARRFTANVVIATIPAVVLGLLLEKKIKAVLFSPVPVAVALILGGVVILWAEARQRDRGVAPRVTSVDDYLCRCAQGRPGPMPGADSGYVALGFYHYRRDAVWARTSCRD
jgi:undecaprenyl-diphosphatase